MGELFAGIIDGAWTGLGCPHVHMWSDCSVEESLGESCLRREADVALGLRSALQVQQILAQNNKEFDNSKREYKLKREYNLFHNLSV